MTILSELRQVFLQGRLYELVAPCLDGRPIEEVCQQLSEFATPAEVFYTVRNLDKRGFLCEQEESNLTPHAGMWTVQELDLPHTADLLAKTPVSITGLDVDTAPLREMLLDLGVRVAEEGLLDIVVTSHYLHRDLQRINQNALETGKPWMLVKPHGVVVWLGPVFSPGVTACWECLASRVRANLPVLGYLDNLLKEQPHPAPALPHTQASLSTAFGVAATAVANWVAYEQSLPLLEGQLQTLNLITLQSESHRVMRQPACGACGPDPSQRDNQVRKVAPQSRKKTYTEDGGHRSMPPQETIEKYKHHVSPISGAVTMLERSTLSVNGDASAEQGPDKEVMHVFVSGNNIARGPQSILNLKVDLRNQSAGKGVNDLQAKASALCEALERHSAVYRGDEPRVQASYSSLGADAIHPNACMLFSERQYAEREARNARASIYNYIPRKFDPDAEIDWTPVWSLTHDSPRYVPTAYCYFNSPHACEHDFFMSCSNGNSAGNSIEEAIVQGFLELVERDAVGIWWYNRVSPPGLDLDSFEVPYVNRVREYLKKWNRSLWALDLTNDLGIPAFCAVSARTDGEQEHLMFGFGAHLDARIAMLRAVTELNQFVMPILEAPQGGQIPYINDPDTVDWLLKATLREHAYLLPSEGQLRTADSYSIPWTDDLQDDVRICREIVEQRGMEMLVLDQTREEIGMPVAKVFVPGLRHFWMRFAPGRLYDVPVRLGWCEQPRAEEELNPSPMFL
ncbi:MAG: TOMM precursor leader peptide-binding protein [Planctomycetales bacterium]|nr:TOMM precursor leader peptide-binding protein [Planctomycetales bacterium]